MTWINANSPDVFSKKDLSKKSSVKKFIRRNERNIAVSAVFFFISLASLFETPAFYVLLCLFAWTAGKENSTAPWLGFIFGACFQMLWGIKIPIWNIIVSFCIPFLKNVRWKKTRMLSFAAVLFLLPGEIIRLTGGDPVVRDFLLSALSLLAAFISMPALCRTVELVSKPSSSVIGTDDLLCMILPFMMTLCGMCKIHLGFINAGYCFSVYFVLLNAFVLPWETSVCAGLICGLSLLLGGQGTLWCAAFTAGALLSGIVQGKKRWLPVLIFTVTLVLLEYLLLEKIIWEILASSLAGCLLFLFTPGRMIQKYSFAVQKCSILQRSDNPYLQEKLEKWGLTMNRLANAVPEPNFSNESAVDMSEELAERVCENCPEMMFCWHEHFDERKEQFTKMTGILKAEKKTDLLCEECIQKEKLMKELKNMLDKIHMNEHRRRQAAYEQSMLTAHFSSISQAMMQLAKESTEPAEGSVYMEKQIEEILSYVKYPGKVKYVKKINNHYTVGLYCSPFLHPENQDMQLKHYISLKLEADMVISEKKDGYLIFEEAPPFRIEKGIASACAVSTERNRKTPYEVINGDATAVRTLCGGFEMAALSDGMGHGKGAGRESTKTLELLTLCLEAGYTRMQAMNAVNGMMLSSTGGERFATVDLSIINLWTGEVCLNKLGACLSLMVQGQNIRTIEGAALPLGIIEHIIPMEHNVRLGRGDMLILISDGIADAFDHTEEISEILKKSLRESPQQIADTILQEAVYQSSGLPADDMTVIVLKMEANKKRA